MFVAVSRLSMNHLENAVYKQRVALQSLARTKADSYGRCLSVQARQDICLRSGKEMLTSRCESQQLGRRLLWLSTCTRPIQQPAEPRVSDQGLVRNQKQPCRYAAYQKEFDEW